MIDNVNVGNIGILVIVNRNNLLIVIIISPSQVQLGKEFNQDGF